MRRVQRFGLLLQKGIIQAFRLPTLYSPDGKHFWDPQRQRWIPGISGGTVVPYGFVADSILEGATTAGLTGGTTTYIGPVGHQATALNAVFVLPQGGTLRNLFLNSNTAATTGQSYVGTIQRSTGGGALANTGITCTVAGATQLLASDLTHTQVCLAGDLITLQVVASAGAATAFLSMSIQLLG